MSEILGNAALKQSVRDDRGPSLDLARSRRADRTFYWILILAVEAGLLVSLAYGLHARGEFKAAQQWARAHQRPGHRAPVIPFDPVGDDVLFRIMGQVWWTLEIVTVWAAVGLLQRGKERLSVGAEGFRMEHTFGSVEASYGSIARLSVFQPLGARGSEGSYAIHLKDGREARFHVQRPDAANPEISGALAWIEERSGWHWAGRGERKRLDLHGFWTEFKSSAGVQTPLQVARWIVRHAFMVRPEAAGGLDAALLRWSIPFFILPLFAAATVLEFWLALSPVLIIRSEQILDSQKLDFIDNMVVLPHTYVALALAGWITTCLGVNAIMALLRHQEGKREALESEMAAARHVQQRLLPSAAPAWSGLDIAGVCTAAKEVGGDYYDYLSLSSGQLVVAVADVSGKGLPAGLLMTLTKGALKTAFDATEELSRVVSGVNRTIHDSAERGMFVSMAIAKIEAGSGSVQIARAGHNPPLIVRTSGQAEWIAPSGMALGLDAGGSFERVSVIREVKLEAGDALVLYTDGVTEAMNDSADEYGEERLAAAVARSRGGAAASIRDAVLDEVRAFRRGATANDDLTLVVVKHA